MDPFDGQRLEQIALACNAYLGAYKGPRGRTLRIIADLHELTDDWVEPNEVPETLGIRVRERAKARARLK